MAPGMENTFRKRFCDALHALRGERIWMVKTHGNIFTAGQPDVIGCDAEMGPFALELKAVKTLPMKADAIAFEFSALTALQAISLQAAAKAGIHARMLVWIEPLKVAVSVPAQLAARGLKDGTNWTRRELELIHHLNPDVKRAVLNARNNGTAGQTWDHMRALVWGR